MSDSGWALIGMASFIIIGFIYVYLKVNGIFNKFRKKKK